MFKAKRGFTLIELLIVIVIIGILAGIVVGIVGTSANNKAQDVKKKSAITDVQTALEQYFLDNNSKYPDAATTADMKTTLVAANLLKDTVVLTDAADDAIYGIKYVHQSEPEGYTLSFKLRNQGDNTVDNIKGSSPDKVYQVTSTQQ